MNDTQITNERRVIKRYAIRKVVVDGREGYRLEIFYVRGSSELVGVFASPEAARLQVRMRRAK